MDESQKNVHPEDKGKLQFPQCTIDGVSEDQVMVSLGHMNKGVTVRLVTDYQIDATFFIATPPGGGGVFEPKSGQDSQTMWGDFTAERVESMRLKVRDTIEVFAILGGRKTESRNLTIIL